MSDFRFPFVLGLLVLWWGSAISAQDLALHVYKDPNCGCCTKWIEHLDAAAISTSFSETTQLNGLKAHYGIHRQYQSCHTAVTKLGYVFEGHVPAKVIQQFMAAPPKDAIGLAVPGMPAGSPGMEMGDRFQPYQVLLLKKDGSFRVFADMKSQQDQF